LKRRVEVQGKKGERGNVQEPERTHDNKKFWQGPKSGGRTGFMPKEGKEKSVRVKKNQPPSKEGNSGRTKDEKKHDGTNRNRSGIAELCRGAPTWHPTVDYHEKKWNW